MLLCQGGIWVLRARWRLHLGVITSKSVKLYFFALNPPVNQAGVVQQKAQSPISVASRSLRETSLVSHRKPLALARIGSYHRLAAPSAPTAIQHLLLQEPL